MNLNIVFDKIKKKAAEDDEFREAVLSACKKENSIVGFCRVCNAAGIEIYPMDIADADESEYSAMRRSTNGGGENSPHLIWEDGVFADLIHNLSIHKA